LRLDARIGQRLPEARQPFRVANVGPVTPIDFTGNLPGADRALQKGRERESTGPAALEKPGSVKADTAVGPRTRPTVAELAALQAKVATRIVVRVRNQHQMSQAFRRTSENPQLEIGPDVSVDDQEGPVPQYWQRAKDAAPRLQRRITLPGVDHLDPETAAVTNGPGNLLAKPTQIDDHPVYSGSGNRHQVPLDKGSARDFEEWLGFFVGQRSHALTATGGQNHGGRRRIAGAGAVRRP